MFRTRWTGFSGDTPNALDVGRGIAIVCVMYGHALAPWFMNAGDHFSQAAYLQWKLGASFMMALFFFLSGIGWREDKSLISTARQSLALVLIALLASAAYDAVRLLASWAGVLQQLGGQPIDAWSFAAGIGRMVLFGDYYSFSALWFLVALGLVRMLAAFAVRMRAPLAALLTVALLAATLASTEFGWRNIYQINLIGVAFVFFLAGHLARDLFHAIQRKPAAVYALLLIGGVVLLATFALNQGCRWDVTTQCGAAWLNNQFGVAMINGQFGNLPLFFVTAFAGIAFGSALAMLLARFGGAAGRALDAWGGNSLNLLVVNCVFLHVGNDLVGRFIAPHVAADGVFFFVALFALTLAANLFAARVAERPLRWLHRAALVGASRIVDVFAAAPTALTWAWRGVRVSQRHE
jgi:fucose 4-O-acetylase-like acetyltransferase